MKCQYLRAGRPEARQRLARRPLRHARVQDVQDLVGRPGLRRRRQREHVVPAMVRLRRRRPLARVAGKVVERHRAADGSRLLDDGAGDRTLVEAVAALLLQDPERRWRDPDCGRCRPRPGRARSRTTSRSHRGPPACSIREDCLVWARAPSGASNRARCARRRQNPAPRSRWPAAGSP